MEIHGKFYARAAALEVAVDPVLPCGFMLSSFS